MPDTESKTTPQQTAPAGAESVLPYGAGDAKEEQVRRMFDNIAPAYDLMNTAMSFGLHRRWRDRALTALESALRHGAEGTAGVQPRLLDVATGTGDVAFELWRRLRPCHVEGIDLSEGMLSVARRKLAGMPAAARGAIAFRQADCLALPYADGTFDAVTVAYGVRNFSRLRQGYAEMLRVLRPGGVLCVIELARPVAGPARMAYDLYSRRLIPAVGRLVSGDSRAYTYLPESIAAAPQRGAMTALMLEAGFARASWRTLTMGAVAVYLARKGR